MNNYTIYHSHDDMSLLDSSTKYESYIKRAKELNMTSFGLSNHGNIFNWTKKKQKCDEYGIKYIHGQEFYITYSLKEKVRDNWHCILIAKNLNGVKELNKLSSLGYTRDNHFYYDPRISMEELFNTSNNIITTSSCLGGLLNSGVEEIESLFINFMIKNKHRCFLEIQHHNNIYQSEYNKKLYDISKHYDIMMIAGTDTHNLDKKSEKARVILQKSKGINFQNETSWDLNFKSYEELIECYKEQNSIPKVAFMEAIENTNNMANMIQNFELDLSYKYPKIYENSNEIFKNKVYDSLHKKELNNNKEYLDRIEYEFEAISKNGAIDYLLLQEKITSWCRENNIIPGYSRGSVSGSLCAYLLGITDIDSIKFNMNFERFMNSERVSLSDIDIDYPPNKREEVKGFIFNNLGLNCCDIVAFNTVASKGSIRDVGRALQIPLDEINDICKNLETLEDSHNKKYNELFDLAKMLDGTTVSSGVHPCGVVTTTLNIDEEFGTFTTTTDTRKISQVDMKCIDSLNFVKLDILGLDNIQIINETCDLAGIERLSPDNIDFEDDKVWKDMTNSNVGIFQWESDFAHQTFKKLFSEDTLSKIRFSTGKIDRMSLLSMANGAIRPAGESYREPMCNGIFKDNGHEALNNLLSSTMGYLVYQEDILKFLNQFCGYSMGNADIIRRCFAKKSGDMEKYLPDIKSGFIKTMKEKYNTPEKESEKIVESFLRVIEDASAYLFSLNHSYPYSMIGYACAYLRYYYKLEFLTTTLNINKNNIEKSSSIISYAKTNKINVSPPKFRFSRSSYFFNKETNTIYKDISSIKFLNNECGEELYGIGKNKFDNFVDLLIYIEENTKINSRQISTLIKIKFFDEFGKNKKLLNIYNEFSSSKNKYDKKLKQETKNKRIEHLKNFENNEINKEISVWEQIAFEQESLGYIQVTYNLDKKYVYVQKLNEKFSPLVECYSLATGNIVALKIQKKLFENKNFLAGDVIYCKRFSKRPSVKFVDGKFVEIEGEFTWWLEDYDIIEQDKIDGLIKGNL